jgi:hypothetical protein
MLTRELLWTRTKLDAAAAVLLLASLALLLALSARPAGAQVSLLPPDQIGAQARPDLAFSNRTPTKVFHVAKTGSDSNPGTRELPWRTIRKAAATLGPGQAAYVHTGTYYERVDTTNPGTSSAPIWLMEAPGENVVIKGGDSSDASFILIDQPYWIIDGFEVNAAGSPANAVRFAWTHHVVVKNINAHSGFYPEAVVFFGSQDAALLNSKLHDYKWHYERDSHGVGIWSGNKRILLKGNDSWGHAGDDVQCASYDAPEDYPVDITIEGNRYGNTHPVTKEPRPRTRENAIDIKNCRNVTIRDNKMFGFRPSPVPPPNSSPHGDALVVHENAGRVLIEGNRIWNSSRGASIGAGNGTLGPIVFRRNLLFDMATGTGLSTDTVGSGNGVRISNTSEVEYYQNVSYNLRGKAIVVGDEGSVSRADVINNIVQKAATGFSRGSVSSLTIQKNLFWETPQGVPSGSLVADPRFVDDPRNNDFYTKPGSPARDVALREPLPVDPRNSTYCHAGPDIGFLESCT